jgi:hypothetical protein
MTYPVFDAAVNRGNEGYVMSKRPSAFSATTVESTAALRDERTWLLARYDSGALTPTTFKIIRGLEVEISWAEHRAVRS